MDPGSSCRREDFCADRGPAFPMTSAGGGRGFMIAVCGGSGSVSGPVLPQTAIMDSGVSCSDVPHGQPEGLTTQTTKWHIWNRGSPNAPLRSMIAVCGQVSLDLQDRSGAVSFMIAVCDTQPCTFGAGVHGCVSLTAILGALPARERRTALRTQRFPAETPAIVTRGYE